MALLFSSTFDGADEWRDALARLLPDLEFRVWPQGVGDPADIEYALVWEPGRGMLRRFPNLKAIFSLGAGVDHLMDDPDLPAGVPVVRLVDGMLTRGMTEYIVARVLHYHRQFHLYRRFQEEGRWKSLEAPDTARRGIGILGLGVLGGEAARALVGLGFGAVAGWSRGPKSIDGVESFHGEDALMPFLGRTEILVCVLPHTPATEGIIDARALAALPGGSCLINPARGGHVVDKDLLAALDSGHIAHATLDVFREEPLAADHPYWRHSRVTLTPHIASRTVASSAAREVAEDIRRIGDGLPPRHPVDPVQGY